MSDKGYCLYLYPIVRNTERKRREHISTSPTRNYMYLYNREVDENTNNKIITLKYVYVYIKNSLDFETFLLAMTSILCFFVPKRKTNFYLLKIKNSWTRSLSLFIYTLFFYSILYSFHLHLFRYTIRTIFFLLIYIITLSFLISHLYKITI